MNTKAYTLVETLVALLILSFVLLGVCCILLTGNAIFTKETTLIDMQAQTRNAVDRIVREARQASSQTITANYNSTTNDKISLTIPTATGIMYYLSGTDLIREYPVGTTKKIASNIAYLKFTLTGSLLKIQARADKTMYSNVTSFPLTEKVRLRNE